MPSWMSPLKHMGSMQIDTNELLAERPWLDSTKSFSERAKLIVGEMTVEEKLSQLNYRNKGIPRLDIPPYVWWNEALHGLARSGTATVFPQAIGMAATFNPRRLRQMGEIIAKEARARHHESVRQGDYGTYKGLTFWSPNINIFRDPRWGRGHETYGEDPCLTATMGVAYVEGLQGDHPKYLKAVATPKHYAVHSGPELDRLSFNSEADERDLQETYLPAFKACFKAGAQSVMTAYNALNGEPCSTSDYLINQILRKEWGFQGAVVTDAGAGEALYKEHQTVNDYPEALAMELSRGVDVIVDWEDGANEAWQRGLINENDLDRAIYNQIMVKLKLGFFDETQEVPFSDTSTEVIECDEHLAAAREATRESLVLLKNADTLLPLSKKKLKTIAVIGPNADARDVLLGNYHGTPSRQVTLLQGIQNEVGTDCRVLYAKGCELNTYRTEEWAEDNDRYSEAVNIASRADVAILCLGLNPKIEGESGDTFNVEAGGDKLQIELHEAQDELVNRVASTGTPIIVLMFAGSAVISNAVEEKASALLHCWYPGAEAGTVIAKMLLGEYNPSGRLPVTFYKRTSDLPPFEDYSMENRTYRFFKGEVAYPFGFGLSYSTFHYLNFELESKEDKIIATVTVINTGDSAGDEVVQIYASQTAEFRTPIRSLVAFERVFLHPQQLKRLKLEIDFESLKLTAPNGEQSLYPGTVKLTVGGTQPDERSLELASIKPLKGNIEIKS